MKLRNIFISVALLSVIIAGLSYLRSVRWKKKSEPALPLKPENISSRPSSDLAAAPEKPVSLPAEAKHPESTEPEWLKTAVALYQKYQDTWRKTPSSTFVEKSISVSARTVRQPDSLSESPAISPGTTSLPGSSPTSISSGVAASPAEKRTPETSPAVSSPVAVASLTGSSTTPADTTGSETGPENNSGQVAPVFITRKIKPLTGGGNQVILTITIGETISGLIVTEEIPENYAIYSASPNYAKKVNQAHKWLFYGTSVPSQQIVYEVRGRGSGNISGSFTSSRGSGIITGDSRLGN